MINHKQLWLLIQTQLPDYLRHDKAYEKLIAFLEAYFAFLQEEGELGPVEVISNTEFNRTIDTTLDAFVEHFTSTYLENFPILYNIEEADPVIKAQKRAQITRVVKHASDIYTAKSVEDAYRALFRVLYDEEIDFFYPKTVILKPSDGKWRQNTTIKIYNLTGDDINALDLTYGSATAFDLTPTDVETGAKATVESIIATTTGLGLVHELFLTPNSVVLPTRAYQASPGGSPYAFKPGNKVKLQFGSLIVYGTVVPVPSLITVNDTVGGHVAGEPLYVGNGIDPVNPLVLLSAKSVTDAGVIKAINVVDPSYQIESDETKIFDGSGNQVGTTTIGGLTYYPGAYTDVDGFLSDQIKLRGPLPNKAYATGHTPAEYYQEFSYVIRTSIGIDQWKDTVKKILHPVGYEVFGDVVINPSSGEGTAGANLLGMFNFNTDDINDPDTINGGYLYHLLMLLFYSFVQTKVSGWATSAAESYYALLMFPQPENLLGPTLETVNRFKFVYPPYAGGPQYYGGTVSASNVGMLGGSSGPVPAWDAATTDNTQIKDFKRLRVGDFFNGKAKTVKASYTPEPYMIITP